MQCLGAVMCCGSVDANVKPELVEKMYPANWSILIMIQESTIAKFGLAYGERAQLRMNIASGRLFHCCSWRVTSAEGYYDFYYFLLLLLLRAWVVALGSLENFIVIYRKTQITSSRTRITLALCTATCVESRKAWLALNQTVIIVNTIREVYYRIFTASNTNIPLSAIPLQ